MRRNSWGSKKDETMRARLQAAGIAVNEPASEEVEGGIEILPDPTPLQCRVMVHAPGIVQYILRLRLLSDDANRVISGFMIEASTDTVRLLEPRERVSQKYLSWDPDTEDILNDHIGQAFGPTLVREGLLLGESLKSPAVDRRQRWALITVVVVDQFDHCYEKAFPVLVHDEIPDAKWAAMMRPERRGAGLFELDEDATPEERRKAAAFLETLRRDLPPSDSQSSVERSPARVNGIRQARGNGRAGHGEGVGAN